MIEIKPLPEDYKHPANVKVRATHGLYENGKLEMAGSREELGKFIQVQEAA